MKFYSSILGILISVFSYSQTITTYTSDDGLLSDQVLSVCIGENDEAWFGTQEGICSYDGFTWSSFTETDGLIDNTVFAIMMDSEGVLWCGTDFGISAFDGSDWTNYTTADGLLDNRIKHIFEDSEGIIWFANNDGVSSFDGTDFTNYGMTEGLPFGGVNHVNEDSQGNIWLATGLGGAFLFDGSTFEEFSMEEGLMSNNIRSIAIDENDVKWFATNIGVSVLDASNLYLADHDSLIELPEPHEINPVEDVKIDSQGRVWCGVYVDYLVTVGGVSLYLNDEWTGFDEDDNIAGPGVSQLAIDSMDDVWIATSSGVTKITSVPVLVEEKEVYSFNIFPNPSDGILNINSSRDWQKIEVYNSQSKLVFTKEIATESSFVIDLHFLPSGIYFVKLGESFNRVFIY